MTLSTCDLQIVEQGCWIGLNYCMSYPSAPISLHALDQRGIRVLGSSMLNRCYSIVLLSPYALGSGTEKACISLPLEFFFYPLPGI